MPDTPNPALLSAAQIAEIRQRLPDIAREHMSYFERDRADLLAHLAARDTQLREVLAGLLNPRERPETNLYYMGANDERNNWNYRIKEAAKSLGINDLSPVSPPAPVGETT